MGKNLLHFLVPKRYLSPRKNKNSHLIKNTRSSNSLLKNINTLPNSRLIDSKQKNFLRERRSDFHGISKGQSIWSLRSPHDISIPTNRRDNDQGRRIQHTPMSMISKKISNNKQKILLLILLYQIYLSISMSSIDIKSTIH